MTTHPTDPPTTGRPPEVRTPCSDPDPCDPVTGEPCDRHETEQAHAEGEHEHCGTECEVEYPTEQLRNFILAKGYPGTAGMLDELLRRAAAGQSADAHAHRAGVLREVADEILGIDAHPNASGHHSDIYKALAHRFRRQADELEKPEPTT